MRRFILFAGVAFVLLTIALSLRSRTGGDDVRRALPLAPEVIPDDSVVNESVRTEDQAAPPNNSPSINRDAQLTALRRVFQKTIQTIGTPDASGQVIELEGFRIFTSTGPRIHLHEGHGSKPYFVQFAGPILPEWRERVVAVGGIVHGYVPQNALSVDLAPGMVKQLLGESFVRWIHPIEPAYKIQPFIASLLDADNEEVPEIIPITISTYTSSDAHAVAGELASMRIVVQAVEAGKRWGWIQADVSRERIAEIAALDRVQWIEERVSPRMLNNQAVMGPRMNVTNVWVTRGLTGAGQIIGHADTGLDTGNPTNLHQDIRNQLVAAYGLGRPGRWDDTHGHGTHTAGSILGNGTMSTGVFRGVAWEAGLVHQSLMDSFGGLGGLPPNLNQLYLQTYDHGARLHSDSWGSSVYGVYTTASRQSDEFMWDHPEMLLVFAAGNDGWDPNADGVIDLDSMAAPGTAKNVLTVGASESGRQPGEGGFSSSTYYNKWPFDYPAQPIRSDYISRAADMTNQGMAAFSSRGPTDDGRIKPDLVAPGTDVVSTRSRIGFSSGWGVNANTNYQFNGGTSMSTPLVAGAAALVRQYMAEYRYYNSPSAALVKAALMHGAQSLFPGQYGVGIHKEIPAAIPNPVEGWGQVDVENTLFPDGSSWIFVDEKIGVASPGDVIDHSFHSEAGEVKITLHYTDYPAMAGVGLKLVNDLAISLVDPDGDTLVSHESSDLLNNTERMVYQVESSGVYRVRVHGLSVPQGPQPYAVIVSGPVYDVPVILHTPLINTYITDEPYRVEAIIASTIAVPSVDVSLYWRVDDGTSTYQQVVMEVVTGDVVEAWIPAHPNPTEIHYYLEAAVPGFMTTHPASAPLEVHQFLVTDPVTLSVGGTPAPIFSVSPNYGVHTFAYGNNVLLRAPPYTNTSPGVRVAIAGWTGDGSVPVSGEANEVDVQLLEDSSISWEWVTQYALTQTSTVAGILSTTTWWNSWSAATTLTAKSELVHTGAAYGFAGWLVDGLRQPDAASEAVNPAAGLFMYGPRAATAVYLPASLDANANGLPDWWEQYYFGSNITYAAVDTDGDGFTNIKEYQDRTNPRSAGDAPQPPAIAHMPLANPQTSPAPWSISAVIVDNHAVSNAAVIWRRNGGNWTTNLLSVSGITNFGGTIPSPGFNRDEFQYRMEAWDYAGLTAVSGPFTLQVAYPEIAAMPNDFGELGVPADSVTNVILVITNFGVTRLEWQLSRVLFYDHVEDGTGTWTSAGVSNVWHIQTNRTLSGSHAWHFGNGPFGKYPDHANAWIVTHPILLHAPALLRFDHWARMEYDAGQMDDHYWDGAVVELSVDGGESFVMIEPVGGYPHRITENPASPFPPETPCYGETDGWEPADFDLSEFTGEAVRIRFRFGADKYVVEEGWYIDNIRIVYQDDGDWAWLLVESNGTVEAGYESNVVVTINSASLELAERRHATLVLDNNDPERKAPVLVPVGVHNISREITVTHNGYGTVTPGGVVRVILGEDASFWLQPDAFYVVGEVFTNGESASGYIGSDADYYVWPDPQSNGTLHVEFTEKLILDLVPEWWLFQQGLTNASPSVEAQTDHDGDGMLSWQEYWAGTDPHDPESVAMIIWRVTPAGEHAIVEWLSFTNMSYAYELLVTTNLIDGFESVADGLPATPPVNVFTNEHASPGFEVYRVLAVP